MDAFQKRFIHRFQEYRSRHGERFGKKLLSVGISANLLTFFSLVTGLLAVYWLFSHYALFVLLALLHLLFDSLDGVVARISGASSFGKYFDQGSDSFVTVLVLFKVGWYLQDFYAYVIAAWFFLAVIIYFLSRGKAPIIFMRTVAVLILIVVAYPGFPFQKEILTAGYLVAGIVAIFSLARQLQWGVERIRGL